MVNKMRQYELNSKALSYSHCFSTLNQATISMRYFTKVHLLFPCSSKSFLSFRLSSTRLLIKWFLIKNVHTVEELRTTVYTDYYNASVRGLHSIDVLLCA